MPPHRQTTNAQVAPKTQRKSPKSPRSPNAFIIFRNHALEHGLVERVIIINGLEVPKTQTQLSGEITRLWKCLPASGQRIFYARAEELKKEREVPAEGDGIEEVAHRYRQETMTISWAVDFPLLPPLPAPIRNLPVPSILTPPSRNQLQPKPRFTPYYIPRRFTDPPRPEVVDFTEPETEIAIETDGLNTHYDPPVPVQDTDTGNDLDDSSTTTLSPYDLFPDLDAPTVPTSLDALFEQYF
ncbi:hypothetical protein PM082_022049 [Marasmius tenuissimus]|nr:hypothetical protein PM082_022049 [Marasmius tenuissimus]